jgi:predicted NAD/FAD-binding protein
VRIAIVGGGVSGLVAAWLLSRRHEVTLFEKEPRLGGHAHTHVVEQAGRTHVLDTGFLVFNERTYPLLRRLFAELGVEAQPSEMSFGVRCRRCGLEYASRSTGAFLAQRWRAFDPRHVILFREIRRFHGEASAFLDDGGGPADTVGGFLERRGFGSGFVRHFLLPMTGAIWSASFSDLRQFAARTIFQFLRNHGLLAISGAPTWYTVKGGSHTYVRAMSRALEGRVRLGAGVEAIARDDRGVTVTTAKGGTRVDAVVVATHADEGLALLADPSPEERDALGAFRYSRNRTVLHMDRAALPSRRAAWASWNLDLADCRDERAPVSVTYHLNRLQRLPESPAFLVSLNRQAPIAGPALATMEYTHPILDAVAIAAQPRIRALNGTRRTYFCGAHLRYGFHEDGVMSAVDVAARLGVEW